MSPHRGTSLGRLARVSHVGPIVSDRLAAATEVALRDPGVDKMRYLCWIVMEIEELPKLWCPQDRLRLCDANREQVNYEYMVPVQAVASRESE